MKMRGWEDKKGEEGGRKRRLGDEEGGEDERGKEL
jgi:hypothetical protein